MPEYSDESFRCACDTFPARIHYFVSMHPRLAELVAYAESQREGLLVAVATFPDAVRGRRVHSSTWSVAEILEHLYRVESGIVRLLSRCIQRARAAGLEAERDEGSLLDSLDAFRLTDRATTVTAPEPVLPRGDLSASQALTALEQSRDGLLAAAAAGDGLALGTITYPHPLLGALNLYQWILFVGQHEARHAKQIEELADLLSAEAGRRPRRPE